MDVLLLSMAGRRSTIPLADLGGARFHRGCRNALPRARIDPKLSEQTYGEFAVAGSGRALPMSLQAEESTCAHRTVAGTSIELGSRP